MFNNIVRGVMIAVTFMVVGLTPACLTAIDDRGKIGGEHDDSVDRANNFFARGRYTQSTEIYRRMIERYPDSPHIKPALLGLADSLYRQGEDGYFEAIMYYERFIELYPLDPLTPRAFFYMSMCYYKDSHTPDRDQTNTRKAITAFEGFLELYPKSEMAPYARQYKREMETKLLESEMEVARFYHRVNKNHSAIRRIQEYLEQHPDSLDRPEALFMLGECYQREEAFAAAAQSFNLLISESPDSEWAAKAIPIAQQLVASRSLK